MKNCINCQKEIGGKAKKYCSKDCANKILNVKVICLSTKLSPQNVEKVLALQKELLKQQELEEK